MGRPPKDQRLQKRRITPPLIVQQLWKTLVTIRQQRQVPNLERMAKFMGRDFGMKPNETEVNLTNCEEDGLILKYNSTGIKGKAGQEQPAFRLPDMEALLANRETHDWYCFECHRAGDVLKCKGCWRVYHSDCVDDCDSGTTFYCALCKICQKKTRIPRRELNRLLMYTVQRLKAKTRELHRLWVETEEDKEQLYLPLLYQLMDLNTMQQRVKKRKYRYLEEFQADARLILHNVMIVYEDPSTLVDLTRMMLKDCTHDLDEIRLCKDCYFMSNAKPINWFCEPCALPHELVYAKQKGFSYWPAKVIKITKDGFDVRFFGGWHQRATVPKSSIKPIDTNPKELNLKKSEVLSISTAGDFTTGFNKACEELKYHRDLLEKQLDRQLEAQRQGITHEVSDIDSVSGGSVSDLSEVPDYVDIKDMEPEYTEGGPEPESDDQEDLTNEKPSRKHESDLDEEYVEPLPKKRKRKSRSVDEYGNEALASTERVLDMSEATAEDAHIVTSSEDKVHRSARNNGTQTSKKLGKPPCKYSQTDVNAGNSNSNSGCNCDAKYSKIINKYESDKEKLTETITKRLSKEFEDTKAQAVAKLKVELQKEKERTRRMTEEECRSEFMAEIKKLGQKHRENISETKKKQWCYNCEEEAMYHCCWNTSYCSIKCQQEHWHKEHKRVCRRKRT